MLTYFLNLSILLIDKKALLLHNKFTGECIMRIDGCSLYCGISYKNRLAEPKRINFCAKPICTDMSFDVLSKTAQEGLKNIHKNLEEIRNLFLKFASYPAKAIAIKEGYDRLTQKNRNQGLSFNLPDNRGSITLRQLRAESDMLRFIAEDRGAVKNIYTKGVDKVIANINQNSPQNLPRRYRYMTSEEINASNIEEYIKYTDSELDRYNKYLEQYRNPTKYKKVQVVRKSKETEEVVQIPVGTNVKRIEEIFAKSPEDFPSDFKLQTGSTKNVLGFSFQTEKGETIKISKITNSKYGDKMIYLRIVLLRKDGTKSFMGVDLLTNKFLMLKEDGKPLIREDAVYEYSDAEVKRRNMQGKLSAYTDEIYKKFKVKEEPQTVNSLTEKEQIKNESSFELPKELNANNYQELEKLTVAKAKQDAKNLAEVYFKTFKESFNELIMSKMNEFKADIEKILKQI